MIDSTPSPTLDERKAESQAITDSYRGSPQQFTVIIIGMSIVGAASMFTLVALAIVVEDPATLAVIGTAILTLCASLTAAIISAVTKIQVTTQVSEVKERIDGRVDDLLVKTEQISAYLAVKKEREEVADRKPKGKEK